MGLITADSIADLRQVKIGLNSLPNENVPTDCPHLHDKHFLSKHLQFLDGAVIAFEGEFIGLQRFENLLAYSGLYLSRKTSLPFPDGCSSERLMCFTCGRCSPKFVNVIQNGDEHIFTVPLVNNQK